MKSVFSSLAVLSAIMPMASAAATGSNARIYLYPAAGRSSAEPVSINAPDANRILSHHLNIPGERLGPIVSSSKQSAAEEDAWSWSAALRSAEGGIADLLEDTKNRLVIYVDGVQDADSLLPSTDRLRATHQLQASSPSSDSWAALISSYGDKLSQVVTSEGGLLGGKLLETFSHAADNVRDWFAGEVMPVGQDSVKKTLDVFDMSPSEASAAFHEELAKFAAYVDKMASSKGSSKQPEFQALRFQSLPALREAYGENSEQYKSALKAVGAALQSAVETFKKYAAGREQMPRLAILVSDSARDAGIQKRDVGDLLAPFSTAARQFNPQQSMYPEESYASPSYVSNTIKPSPSQSGVPVESDYLGKCFTSEADLLKATAGCSGHGDAVQKDIAGKKCYRCQCKADRRKEGRVTYYAGEACEKVDISSPFVLLATTTIVLVLLVAGSIGYMTSMGEQQLPGTLASVSIPNFKL